MRGKRIECDLTVLLQFSSVPLGHHGRPQTPQLLHDSPCHVDTVENWTIAFSLNTFISSCQRLTHDMLSCDGFQCLLLMIKDVTMFSNHVCVCYGTSMAYEIMEYTPSAKCSNPFFAFSRWWCGNIIIIKLRGKAVHVPFPFKFFIQMAQITNTKPFPLLCDPVLVLDWNREMSAFFQELKISRPQV